MTARGGLDEASLVSSHEEELRVQSNERDLSERKAQIRRSFGPLLFLTGSLAVASAVVNGSSIYLGAHGMFNEDKVSSNYTDADGTRVSRVTYDDAHVMELLNGESTNGSRFDYDGNGTWDSVDITRTSGNATTYEKVDPSLFEVAAKTFWAHHRN